MEAAAAIEKLEYIETEMEKQGIKIPYNQAELKKQIKGLHNTNDLNTLQSSLSGIGSAIGNFMSNDPQQIASAGLSIIANVTQMLPVVGQVVGGLFSMVSSIVGAFGGKKTSMAEVFYKVFEKALAKYDDKEIKSEAVGVKEELVTLQRFLNKFAFTDSFSRDEVLAMDSADLSKIAKNFLGTLKYHIKLYAINKSSTDNDDVAFQATRAVDYVEAFCQLSVLRELVLIQYYSILKKVGGLDSTAEGIWAAITEDDNEV